MAVAKPQLRAKHRDFGSFGGLENRPNGNFFVLFDFGFHKLSSQGQNIGISASLAAWETTQMVFFVILCNFWPSQTLNLEPKHMNFGQFGDFGNHRNGNF